MRMNVAAYPPVLDPAAPTIDRMFPAHIMAEVLANGEALFDPTATTKLQDDQAARAIDLAADAQMRQDPTGGQLPPTITEVYSPSATSKYETGVAALEWVRGGQTVLCFRGSYSPGDFANIENWLYATTTTPSRTPGPTLRTGLRNHHHPWSLSVCSPSRTGCTQPATERATRRGAARGSVACAERAL
jgi:hypothetical protein